jgi:hypothetical protein
MLFLLNRITHLSCQRISKGWFSKDGEYIPSDDNPGASRSFNTFQQALELVHHGSKTKIAKHSYMTLIAVCVELLGGDAAEFRGKRKDDLLDLIDAYVSAILHFCRILLTNR